MAHLEEIRPGEEKESADVPLKLDCKGSQCPGPILTLADGIRKAVTGQQVIIEVTDPGFKADAVAWADITGNPLVSMTDDAGVIRAAFLKKRELGDAEILPKEDIMTLIVFSDELDRGLAAFNIALGALALGMKVEVFFTFWGLSLIRKHPEHPVHKDMMGRVLEKVLPDDDKSLPLSHRNIMGIGAKMMERIMKDKNVPPLDFMIHLAKYDGVKFIACQMSMEILGISADELIDGVMPGGVATMLQNARKSTVNYFI